MADATPAPGSTPAPAPAPVPSPAGGGAPPPAPAPAPAPETILNAPAPADGAAPPPAPVGDWPSDWRERLAGEDTAYLKTLARLATPMDLAKKARSLEQKLSSGEYTKPFPAQGTPDEQAAWRAEVGIPDKPDGYVEKVALPGGLVLGEADKPIVREFAQAALEANIPPEAFNKMVAQYYAIQEQQAIARAEQDGVYHQESIATLGAEFGANLKRELNIVNSFLSANMPKDVCDDILAARSTKGHLLGDDPAFVKAFIGLAREVNPLGSLLPSGVGDVGKAAGDRLNEIKTLMANSQSEYWQGPKAAGLQSEYLALIEGQQKHNARSAA